MPPEIMIMLHKLLRNYMPLIIRYLILAVWDKHSACAFSTIHKLLNIKICLADTWKFITRNTGFLSIRSRIWKTTCNVMRMSCFYLLQQWRCTVMIFVNVKYIALLITHIRNDCARSVSARILRSQNGDVHLRLMWTFTTQKHNSSPYLLVLRG
jgi:hypothetical protein